MMTDPDASVIGAKVDVFGAKVDALSEQNKSLTENVSKMAESITEFTITVARAEERHINMSDRMERIEENQKEQGKDIGILKESVQSNTFVTRATIKVTAIIVTAIISGAVGMFYYFLR